MKQQHAKGANEPISPHAAVKLRVFNSTAISSLFFLSNIRLSSKRKVAIIKVTMTMTMMDGEGVEIVYSGRETHDDVVSMAMSAVHSFLHTVDYFDNITELTHYSITMRVAWE